MSGHSKWSTIKRKKGALDAKRGRLFTRLAREIIVAAREGGGGDVEQNPRLRSAVQAARQANMPGANIDKAIKRGTGEIEGAIYEEIVYEGYGQAGVAIIVETMTDNKNRTVAEVRHAFSKYGGNLAENGAVSWNFDQKGVIIVPVNGKDEDEFMMEVLEFGAEDVEMEDEYFNVYTSMGDLHTVSKAMEDAGVEIEKAELTRVPKNTINADDVAAKLMKLIEQLEDLEDVQKVYANYEISDEVMETLL